jgi:hypothetical protein
MLNGGYFTLTFSEAEVASAVEAAIASANAAAESDIPLRNTHIALDEDVVLYAQTDGALINASGMMTIHLSVSPDGQLVAEIGSCEFGRAAFDDPLLEQVGATVADALASPIDNLPVAVALTNVAVTDRQLVLTGSIVE